MSVAVRDRHRYRLANENVDTKYVENVVVCGSRGLQKTELQDLQLGVVM